MAKRGALQGRRESAAKTLERCLDALGQVDAPAAAYDAWVQDAQILETIFPEDPRFVGYLALYRGDLELCRGIFSAERFPLERAHALFALAAENATAKHEAAALFEKSQCLVSAAQAYAQAQDEPGAIRCYRRLLGDRRLGDYEQALIHCQLAILFAEQKQPGKSALEPAKDARSSRQHAVAAQELLEKLADDWESAEKPERALDCYRLYIRLGQALRSFENIVEGSINCLRLLKQARLLADVLRHYDELLQSCAAHHEHHLAAAKCREAAEYLERQGAQEARDLALGYKRQGAAALLRAAQYNLERGGPAERSESALLAALNIWNALDDFSAFRGILTKLSQLPLPAASRYRELAERYPDTPLPKAEEPSHAVAETIGPPIWDLDLCEWQADGDPVAVCLGLVGDRKRPQLTRRHAMLVLLHAALLTVKSQDAALDLPPSDFNRTKRPWMIISSLGGLRCYEALRPLERLFAVSDAPLRIAIIQTLPRLPFRRAAALLAQGLADADPGVRSASLEIKAHLQD